MNATRELVIYGAGGLGRELLALVRDVDPDERKWNFLGFVDDNNPADTQVRQATVLGGMERLTSAAQPLAVVIGVADPTSKASIYERLSQNPRISFPTLRHPTALVASSSILEEGVVISAFCITAPDSTIKRGTFLSWYSSVGHDSVLGDFSSLMPSVNVSGNVTIGARTLVGVGAKIHQGLRIGSDAIVGMGSIVFSDVPDYCTVLGNPARVFQKR